MSTAPVCRCTQTRNSYKESTAHCPPISFQVPPKISAGLFEKAVDVVRQWVTACFMAGKLHFPINIDINTPPEERFICTSFTPRFSSSALTRKAWGSWPQEPQYSINIIMVRPFIQTI